MKAAQKIANKAKSKAKDKPVEDKKEVKIRRTQTYSKQKTMFNKLRDL